MFSEKQKNLKVVDGYKFRFQKLLRDNIKRWTCTKKECTAYMKIDAQSAVIFQKLEHSHPPDNERTLARQILNNAVKRKGLEDVHERPQKIIRSELTSNAAKILEASDVNKILKNLSRSRLKLHLPSPETLSDFHAPLDVYPMRTRKKRKRNRTTVSSSDSTHQTTAPLTIKTFQQYQQWMASDKKKTVSVKTNTDPVEVIDKASLGKRIIIIDKEGNASKRGRSQFPLDEEKRLVRKLEQLMDDTGIIMQPMEIRRFAFYYAWLYDLPHDFDVKTQTASQSWYTKFIKRNPSLTPENMVFRHLNQDSNSSSKVDAKEKNNDASSSVSISETAGTSLSTQSTSSVRGGDQPSTSREENPIVFASVNDVKQEPAVKEEPILFDLELEEDSEYAEVMDFRESVAGAVHHSGSYCESNSLPFSMSSSSSSADDSGEDSRLDFQEGFGSINFDDPIDSFFHSMAQVVKKLKPMNQIRAKKATSDAIAELEMEELRQTS